MHKQVEQQVDFFLSLSLFIPLCKINNFKLELLIYFNNLFITLVQFQKTEYAEAAITQLS